MASRDRDPRGLQTSTTLLPRRARGQGGAISPAHDVGGEQEKAPMTSLLQAEIRGRTRRQQD
ncbi:MAG TPA: hypothetical protein VFO16_15310 [Pseudonocardiaceae bacterium]|nr:hypothetical protein [Pseudonocardiaceae bacterium]